MLVNPLLIQDEFEAQLSKEIQRHYNKLMHLIACIAPEHHISKSIRGTGGQVSIVDLIAYQIGWGSLLLGWYNSGIRGEIPEMPGEGFGNWDYLGLAKHFYQKYHYENHQMQFLEFYNTVKQILSVVEKENRTGDLHRIGVWPWCSLKSGKEWSLSKWIRINSVSPYKRAANLIKSLETVYGFLLFAFCAFSFRV